MIQPGFFDLQDRLHKIGKNGDPLAKINETVNWEMFRPALEKARDKNRQSTMRRTVFANTSNARGAAIVP